MSPEDLAASIINTMVSNGTLDRKVLEAEAANTVSELLDELSLTEGKIRDSIATSINYNVVEDSMLVSDVQRYFIAQNLASYVDIWVQDSEDQKAQAREVLNNLFESWYPTTEEITEASEVIMEDLKGTWDIITLDQRGELVDLVLAETSEGDITLRDPQELYDSVYAVIESYEHSDRYTPTQLAQLTEDLLYGIDFLGTGPQQRSDALETLETSLEQWVINDEDRETIILNVLATRFPGVNDEVKHLIAEDFGSYFDYPAELDVVQANIAIGANLARHQLQDREAGSISETFIDLIDEQRELNDGTAELVAERVIERVLGPLEEEEIQLTPSREAAIKEIVKDSLKDIPDLGPGQGGGNQTIGSLLIAGSIGAAISAVVLSLTKKGSITTSEQPQVVAEILGQMMDSGEIDEAQQEQGMVAAIITALVSSRELSGVNSLEQVQAIMVTPAPSRPPEVNEDFKWEDIREALTVEITDDDRRIGTQPTNEDFRYNKKDLFTVTYRDHKNIQKTFTFDLLPAVEARGSGIPGGSDVPEVKPGLLRVVETRHKNIIVPGAAPVQQSIGLKSTLINLVGMFSGMETIAQGVTPAIPARSQTNDVFLAESGPDGAYKPEPVTKAPGVADAFYREVVSPMTEVKVVVQASNGNEGVTKLTYWGVIIRFKDYYARENRVYYVIDLLLTRYPIQGSGG
jgi:polyhydroxyalkanoate synthesis regulator phasin